VAQIPGLNIIDHSTSLADFSAPRAGGAKTGNERKPSETLPPTALAGNEPLTRPTALAGNEPLTRPTALVRNDPLTRPTGSASSEPVTRPTVLTSNGPLFREQVCRLFVHQNLTKHLIFFICKFILDNVVFYFAGKKKPVINSVAP
jgi:hypothetical protein